MIVFWPWPDCRNVLESCREALANAPGDIPVTIGGGAIPQLNEDAPESLGGRQVYLPATSDNLAVVANEVHDALPDADLVLIADSGVPMPGWFELLRAAAYADDIIAAASVAVDAFDSKGSASRSKAVAGGPATLAAAPVPTIVALRPRVLNLEPRLSWIRASVLDLIGGFDPAYEHPAALLADVAARAIEHGLSCALADDVRVGRRLTRLREIPEADGRMLCARHPWLAGALADQATSETSRLRRALNARRTGTRSVTVDARSLGGVGGTGAYIEGLIDALARSGRLRVRALVADQTPDDRVAEFREAGVETVTYDDAVAGLSRSDVVHRPQQVFTPSDLRLFELLGDRIVITHMDLIGYRIPSYHPDVSTWARFRRVTRLALGAADQVVFLSEHARGDALAEDLVDPQRATVAGIGITQPRAAPEGARLACVMQDRPFLLVLGADYAHKNRPFALRVVDELRRRHGWDGQLVLAGTHVLHGSSAHEEEQILRERPDLGRHVVELGPVSESEKAWLTATATALLCPSSYEGFGLVPLEAAAVGRPCMFAAVTSLGEIIDPEAATIVPWDPVASADAAAPLLRTGAQRDRHVATLELALARHTWEAVVERLAEVYEAALATPYRSARVRLAEDRAREELIVTLSHRGDAMDERARELQTHAMALEARLVELDRHATAVDGRHEDLMARVQAGLPLVDARAGLLTPEEIRGLLRVARRPWLRHSLLASFGLIGQLGSPRRGARPGDDDAPDAAL